jgi:hypothetical protein
MSSLNQKVKEISFKFQESLKKEKFKLWKITKKLLWVNFLGGLYAFRGLLRRLYDVSFK